MRSGVPLPCALVPERFSALRDDDLAPREAAAVRDHLAACTACRERHREWSAALDLLGGLEVPAEPGVAAHVLERIGLEGRGDALSLLLRPAPRPFLRPAFTFAAIIVVLGWTGLWSLGPMPVQARYLSAERPGTEGNPVLATGSVLGPEAREALAASPAVLEGGGGTVFLETVVARDGRVADVRVLRAEAPVSAALAAAMRARRFQPGRYRGQPVAVTVFHLISRVEVRPTPG